MSAGNFRSKDDEKNRYFNHKKRFCRLYHQNGEVNDENQGIKFFLGENLNHIH